MKKVLPLTIAVLTVILLSVLLMRTDAPDTVQGSRNGESCAAPGGSGSGLAAEIEADVNAAVLDRINEHRRQMDMSAVEIMPPDVST